MAPSQNKMEKRDEVVGWGGRWVVLHKNQMVHGKHVTEKWGDGRIWTEDYPSVCLSDRSGTPGLS